MVREHTPAALLGQSIKNLLQELPNIREGADEGVHQGRVAIRRIREVLTIVAPHYAHRALSGLETDLARAGKLLGRARDADIAQNLVQHVEARLPSASAALGTIRWTLAAKQMKAKRRAIKELESLDLKELRADLGETRRIRGFRNPLLPDWRSTLREHIAQLAGEVRSAIDHAGGVYFPNRVHGARIAIKRLRYALELAKATNTWRTPRGIQVLKQAQGALGEAHDREVLISHLTESDERQSRDNGAVVVEQLLRAEIQAFHATYLKLRPGVIAVCDACEGTQARRRSLYPWLLLGSVALPSLLFFSTWSQTATRKDDDVVERRVRVSLA